jgi:hypothetical protein
LSLGWTLVTNNEKEFSRVKGLEMVNWAEDQPAIMDNVDRKARAYGPLKVEGSLSAVLAKDGYGDVGTIESGGGEGFCL